MNGRLLNESIEYSIDGIKLTVDIDYVNKSVSLRNERGKIEFVFLRSDVKVAARVASALLNVINEAKRKISDAVHIEAGLVPLERGLRNE